MFHAVLAFAPGSPLVHATRAFPVAVSFFFVLSGFVLTWSWNDGRPLAAFWRDRAARILPIYVLAWLIAVAALSWLRWPPSQTEMLSSLFLVQAWVPSDHFPIAVNVPSWSLSCEVAFYAALPFVAPKILRTSHRAAVQLGVICAGWIAAAGVLALLLPLGYWPLARAPEFLAGVLLASWMHRGWRAGPRTRMLGLVGTATLVALSASGVRLDQPVATMIAIPGFVALIATVADRDLATGSTRLASRPLTRLGDWSYSLYLTHWVVVVLISRFLVGAIWIPLGIAASIAVAGLLYASLERPARELLRGSPKRSHQLVPVKVDSDAQPLGGNAT
jgi:peptidoglycan/LPS O-acetylase OafA/YrhL